MNAYLVFDLRLALQLLKNSNFFNKKNTIYITDKVVIFNLLKHKNISSNKAKFLMVTLFIFVL